METSPTPTHQAVIQVTTPNENAAPMKFKDRERPASILPVKNVGGTVDQNSGSTADTVTSFRSLRSKFKYLPSPNINTFHIPNSVFLTNHPEDFYFTPEFSFNKLSSNEFNLLMQYFCNSNFALKNYYIKYQKIWTRTLIFSAILTVALAIGLWSSPLPLHYKYPIFYTLLSLVLYFCYILYLKFSSLKLHLLYNLKAYLLQLNIKTLRQRELQIDCDDQWIWFTKEPLSETKAQEFLPVLSDALIGVFPEPNPFEYHFETKFTNRFQREEFQQIYLENKITRNDLDDLLMKTRKAFPYSIGFLKNSALPRWVVMLLFPLWEMTYLAVVLATCALDAHPDEVELALLAPIYALVLPVMVIALSIIVFRVIPQHRFKHKISSTIERDSLKTFETTNWSLKLNIHNDGMVARAKNFNEIQTQGIPDLNTVNPKASIGWHIERQHSAQKAASGNEIKLTKAGSSSFKNPLSPKPSPLQKIKLAVMKEESSPYQVLGEQHKQVVSSPYFNMIRKELTSPYRQIENKSEGSDSDCDSDKDCAEDIVEEEKSEMSSSRNQVADKGGVPLDEVTEYLDTTPKGQTPSQDVNLEHAKFRNFLGLPNLGAKKNNSNLGIRGLYSDLVKTRKEKTE